MCRSISDCTYKKPWSHLFFTFTQYWNGLFKCILVLPISSAHVFLLWFFSFDFFLATSISFSYLNQFTYTLKWIFCVVDRNIFLLPCWCKTSNWRIIWLFMQGHEHLFILLEAWCCFCIKTNDFEPSFISRLHWGKKKTQGM